MSADQGYSGAQNLEVMEQAVRYNRFLLDLVWSVARDADSLVDFGAGSGTFARRLLERGRAPLCVEPDHTLRARLAASGLSVVAALGEVRAESVDAAYSLNVLEHIPDDAAALAELRRVLRPGGRMLLYVPAFMLLFSSMDRRVGHIRRYRRRPLARLVEKAGFTIDVVRYVDSLGFLASLAFRAIGGRDGLLNPSTVVFYDGWVFPLSRALDTCTGGSIGKNLVLRARRT